MADLPPPPAASPRRTGRWMLGAVSLLTALVFAVVSALALLVWVDSSPEERAGWARLLGPRGGMLWLFALALPALFWAAVRPWVAAWPRAVQRLREEVAVIATAHAGHRLTATGPRELRELAQAIESLAQAHAQLRHDVEARVEAARAALGAETRRLAALMSELTVGVLVCNREGRVLLYNARATALLDEADAEAGEDLARAGGAAGSGVPPLGLGRTVGSFIDAAAVEHAWQQVLRRHAQGTAHPVAHFVTVRRRGSDAGRGRMLQAQMVPTLDEGGAPGGYVLLVEDVTRTVHERGRRDAALHRLTEGTRAALGNLRAAAQAMHRYPAMDAGRRAALATVVHEEAERLAAQLGDALENTADAPSTAWPLADAQAGDLVWALQRVLREEGPGPLECHFDGAGADRWLAVDSHAIVQLLAHVVGRLVAVAGAAEVAIEVAGLEPAPARLDLSWRGAPLAPGQLGDWERAPLQAGLPEGASLRVREVLDRHGAEWWAQAGAAGDRHRLSVQLGASGRLEPSRPAHGHRPVAYDFDLFHQAGQSAQLDQTPLARLVYTVFDTETTGLRPAEGDEIIALGAVRIVNGRLLEHERFDRRVRPGRPVRASAEAVHGISNAALAGEPPLEQVLPSFARFCEDTVLVAHNAAFDMRFLETARARTGLAFEQPVLDTMLLSAAVHPAHGSDEHHLEQIAARLGVPVTGRHEALGDALTTARVFLRLLPLLAERGIETLGQARLASQGVSRVHHEALRIL